jgi:hypothetical protein
MVLIIVFFGVNYDEVRVVGFGDGGWEMVFDGRLGKSRGASVFGDETCGGKAGLPV